jgi:hypothetical protein
MRDRDIRNAIRSLLLDTDAFDTVWLTGTPDRASTPSSSQCLAIIEPESSEFTPTWDSALLGGVIVTSKVTISIVVRHPDPQTRDELAEQLFNIAGDTLNGQPLGGFVNPQMTRFVAGIWHKAIPPEREISSTFTYQYILNGWDSADEAP